MMTKLQACKVSVRAAANVARVQSFNAARVVAAVAALAAKWGATGVDPAQVLADQVAQQQRVRMGNGF